MIHCLDWSVLGIWMIVVMIWMNDFFSQSLFHAWEIWMNDLFSQSLFHGWEISMHVSKISWNDEAILMISPIYYHHVQIVSKTCWKLSTMVRYNRHHVLNPWQCPRQDHEMKSWQQRQDMHLATIGRHSCIQTVQNIEEYIWGLQPQYELGIHPFPTFWLPRWDTRP